MVRSRGRVEHSTRGYPDLRSGLMSIVLIATGGTIASTIGADGWATATLSGADLLSRLPTASVADVDVIATECRLDVRLGAVPFLGVLDRVETAGDGVVVTDYKSGRPPAPAYASDKLDQVLLYAAAWRAADGGDTRRARLLYLGARSIEVETTDEAIDGALGRLHQRWDALNTCVSTEEFAPRTGPLCAWCPYTEHCPEGRREVRRRADAGLVSLDAPAVRRLG